MERLGPVRTARGKPNPLALIATLVLVLLGTACGPTSQAGDESSQQAGRSATSQQTQVRAAERTQEVGVSPGHSVYELSEASLNRLFSRFARMGMSWVRVDLNWSAIETDRGQFNWSEPDRMIQTALSYGLQVLPVLCYSPDWATKAPGSGTPPDDPTSMADFARASAARYGPLGVTTWEIWNEPNLVPSWLPHPNPTDYGRLLAVASAAIKSQQPNATVLVAGLAGVAKTRTRGNISAFDFLQALYDGGFADRFDGVSVHPYTYPDLASKGPNAFTRLSRLRGLMVSEGDAHKYLWITETGAHTGTAPNAVSQRRQAKILVDAIEQALKRDWIRLVLIYGGIDAGTNRTDREQNFGFLKADFTPKLSYWALKSHLARR